MKQILRSRCHAVVIATGAALFVSIPSGCSSPEGVEANAEDASASSPLNRALKEQNGAIIPALESLGAVVNQDDDGDVIRIAFSRSAVSGSCLSLLQQFPALERVEFHDCPDLNDDALKQLQILPALTHLTLTKCNQITDAGILHLASMRNLQGLYITRCSGVSGACTKPLGHMIWLSELYLIEIPVTDDEVRNLQRLTRVEKIGLNWKELTNVGIRHLAPLHSLEVLNITGTQVTPAQVELLKRDLWNCDIRL